MFFAVVVFKILETIDLNLPYVFYNHCFLQRSKSGKRPTEIGWDTDDDESLSRYILKGGPRKKRQRRLGSTN